MSPIVIVIMVLGVAFILYGLRSSSKVSIKPRLASEEIERLNIIQRRSYMSFLFPFTNKILESLRLSQKIKDKLIAAHSKLSPSEYFNIKIMLASFGIGLLFLIGKVDIMFILIALLVGFIIPEMMLNVRIAKRKDIIGFMLPETVDLIGLCVEAGLDFLTAIRWVIEKNTSGYNPVLEELSFLLEEIKWGKPRAQALKDMAKRLSVPEISLFVSTLLQAERMGTPTVEAFTIISEDTRLQRFHRGERKALQAPIKILIPLIFCILPVIAIIIAGPIMLQFMQGDMFQVPQ